MASKPRTHAKVDPLTKRLLAPVSVDGITIYPPSERDVESGRPYHRISYTDLAGRRRTTSKGRTFSEANQAATAIHEQLSAGADKAAQSVADLITFHVDPNRKRGKRRQAWSPKTQAGVQRLMNTYVAPVIGRVRCQDLTAGHLQAVITQTRSRTVRGKTVKEPLTEDTRDRLMGAVRRLVKDGVDFGYLAQDPSKLLRGLLEVDYESSSPQPRAVEQGVHLTSVSPSSIPTHEHVAALAYATKTLVNAPWWYELMVYLAAYSGVRIGELFGLEAGDVDTKSGNRARVLRQVNDINGKPVLGLPKRNKTRTTVFPSRTPSTTRYPNGYPLKAMVNKRLRELTSPTDRLFPSPKGVDWHRSNFYRRVAVPAAKKAGWPTVNGRVQWTWHDLRHVFCGYYLWDKQKSPRAVADAAGHSSVSVTLNVYGSAGVAERLNELDK